MRYDQMRDSYPIKNVLLEVSALENLLRFVPEEPLLEKQSVILKGILEIADEDPLPDHLFQRRCRTILLMLRAIQQGKGRRRASHLFEDEKDALCWEVIERGKVSIPDIVKVISSVTESPFSSAEVIGFCHEVLMMANLDTLNLDESFSKPSVWVKLLVGQLSTVGDTDWPNRQASQQPPKNGYVGILANQEPNGLWNTEVIYSPNDSASRRIRANHYLGDPPEIVQVLLMSNSHDEYWAYISCPWELPDGGNVMRVYPNDVEKLTEMGLYAYPMKSDDPHDAFVKWDKSDVLVTTPMPEIPKGYEESMESMKDSLAVIHVSGLITDAQLWTSLVGRHSSVFGYHTRGIFNYRRGNYVETIRDFKEIVRIVPEDYQAHYYIASASQQLGEYRLAIEYFTNTIELTNTVELNPTREEALIKRGECYGNVALLEGNNHLFDSTLNDYDAAITINPFDARWYMSRAQACLFMSREDLARKDLDNAVRLGRNYEDIYVNHETISLSVAVQGWLNDAIRVIEGAMEDSANPKNAADYYWYGVKARYLNDKVHAIGYFERALELGYEDKNAIAQHLETLKR